MSSSSRSSATWRSARQELAAEMAVAGLALDRLDDDARDVVGVAGEGGVDLGERLPLARLDLEARRVVEREAHHRVRDPRPLELREELRLARIVRVGERQRVARAAVKALAEVKDARALLSAAGGDVLADASSRWRP